MARMNIHYSARIFRETLIKSSMSRVADKIVMIARSATKVVARTTMPRSATPRARGHVGFNQYFLSSIVKLQWRLSGKLLRGTKIGFVPETDGQIVARWRSITSCNGHPAAAQK